MEILSYTFSGSSDVIEEFVFAQKCSLRLTQLVRLIRERHRSEADSA